MVSFIGVLHRYRFDTGTIFTSANSVKRHNMNIVGFDTRTTITGVWSDMEFAMIYYRT
jgi:hypothetical protein